MARTPVPSATAAKVMFLSNRTCCVCRKEAKSVQIHHVDGNNRNHELKNLAVLCLDCHTLTQISGGFQRKLDPDQVVLYRDDWHASVTRSRATSDAVAVQNLGDDEIKYVTAIADALKEEDKHVSLAIHYNIWGNPELRDKYIEKAIEKGVDTETEVFLRSLQERPELVDKGRAEAEINRLRQQEQWSQLGRLYAQLGRYRESTHAYCQTISTDLEDKNMFAAAFYLKELCASGLHSRLFEIVLAEQQAKKDLWWTLRSLQELGWDREAQEFLTSNQRQIEGSDNLLLKAALYQALGETDKHIEMQKQIDKNEDD